MTTDNAFAQSGRRSKSAIDRLCFEISYGIQHTPSSEIRKCFLRAAPIMAKSLGRRGKGLVCTMAALSKFAIAEASIAYEVCSAGNARQYVARRGSTAAAFIRTKSASVLQFLTDVVENPREKGPHFILGALSFYLGSGGLDGDGGIPDQDLAFGLGAHRSIFTHSIIPGAAVETLAIVALDLIRTVHANLPADHDKVWDDLVTGSAGVAETFTRYVSAGISCHLGFDATVDGGGTYKDLPFSMPIEGHQAVAGFNAAAEGIDAASAGRRVTSRDVPNASTLYRSRAAAKAAANKHPGWAVKLYREDDGYRLVRP